MIKGQKISYSHTKHTILKDINIQVKHGEFLAIVGPNGAGKSTLLSILANELETKKNGSILFKDKTFKQWNLNELARNKAKFSQHHTNDIPLLVKDVVLMGRYPYFQSTPSSKDLKAIEIAMQETEVKQFQNREYNSLSGGEKQRVHLARVLTQLQNSISKKLLFLDEPLNNLDVKHQYHVLNSIQNFTKNGNSSVVVLHDLNLAAQFADRVVLMKNGEIVACGKPSAIFQEKIIHHAYEFSCKIFTNPITHNPMIVFGEEL